MSDFPILGVLLPFIGRRRVPLNRDGSVVDTGELDMCDEIGPYYTLPLVFEWLGFGFGLGPSPVYDSRTDQLIDPPWLEAAA